MRRPISILAFIVILIACVFYSCTKDVAKNPLLAYSDKALLDSSKNTTAFIYYKDDASTIYPGTTGAHSSFKLKFNKIAATVLTDNGKIPVGQQFPNGSFIVKEMQSGLNAFMYKKEGSWLWAEIYSNGDVLYSVNKGSQPCINCHSQSGNRDLVVSFNFY